MTVSRVVFSPSLHSSYLLSWCRSNSQPASAPALLCPDLLCNWKNWREADSGGYRLWSLNVYFQPVFLIVWRSWVDVHICHWLRSSLSVLIQPAETLLLSASRSSLGEVSVTLGHLLLNVNSCRLKASEPVTASTPTAEWLYRSDYKAFHIISGTFFSAWKKELCSASQKCGKTGKSVFARSVFLPDSESYNRILASSFTWQTQTVKFS